MKNIYDIIICPNNIKNKILKDNPFSDCKYMNIFEFKEKYLFKYRNSAIYYVSKKYNILPENAKIIMDNLYFVKSGTDKLNELLKIKEDLIENNHIVFNDNFRLYIKDKKIGIIGYDETKENKLFFNDLNVCYMNCDIEKKHIKINEFKDIDDEVIFAAKEIRDLIISGIDINNIKLIKMEDVYDSVIHRIFSLFNIPYISKKTSLYNLSIVKDLINKLDLDSDVKSLFDTINNSNLFCKNELLNILSDYYYINPLIGEFYDTFIYILKNTYINKNYKDYISDISFDDVNESDYVFVLGFNQDIIPKFYKDDDYLSDYELDLLYLDNSDDKNTYLKKKILNILNRENVFISYKLESAFDKYKVSNLIEELDYEIIRPSYDYSNYKINQMMFANMVDLMIKYNVKDDRINDLYSNTTIPYNTYNNKYKMINYNTLKEKITSLNLSFSNIDIFYKCKFRFYLENILKLKKYKSTTSIEIGNLFHEVLQKYYETKEDINLILDNVLINDDLDKKKKYYNQKYKKIILELVEIMDKQLENTAYENTYFEKWFSIDKDDDLNIKVVGKIDKIMTLSYNDEVFVVVIDYKTGILHADFNKVIYGLDMQLLMYLYLIKNTDIIKNPNFTGMYLEPIMTSVLKYNYGKTYKEMLEKEYKWVGYTTDNIKYARMIDNNLMTNSFISGLRVKADETFYSTSKTLSISDLDKLLDITSNNIDDVIKSIKLCDFEINPKRLGKNNVSCSYCPYKDICFMTNNDIVNLKEYKNLEFLGGDV